jgi:hypothetical protein
MVGIHVKFIAMFSVFKCLSCVMSEAEEKQYLSLSSLDVIKDN